MQSQDDARLDAALHELKQAEAEPPAGLRPAVMDALRHLPASGVRELTASDGGAMTRKMMFGLAVAAAAVFAILMVTGFPPDLGNIQGTIGQAKRYTAPQMGEGDATIGDPAIQQFLQSDTFAALLKDREAVKALSSPEIRNLLADQALVAELGRTRLAATLVAMEANGSLRQLLDNAELRQTLADANLRVWLDNADLRTQLQKADVRAQLAGNVDLTRALGNADFAAYLSSHAALRTALSDETMLRALTSADFTAALRNPVFSSALNSATFLRAIQNANFMAALRNDSMLRAFSDAAFAKAITSADFAKAISAADLRQ